MLSNFIQRLVNYEWSIASRFRTTGKNLCHFKFSLLFIVPVSFGPNSHDLKSFLNASGQFSGFLMVPLLFSCQTN